MSSDLIASDMSSASADFRFHPIISFREKVSYLPLPFCRVNDLAYSSRLKSVACTKKFCIKAWPLPLQSLHYIEEIRCKYITNNNIEIIIR